MIKQFTIALAAVVLATGCADDELKPIVQFEDLTIGAFPRLVELSAGEYDLQNLGATAVTYTVEFVDGGDGSEVDAYRIYAAFDDRDDSNGDQSAFEILLRDVQPSDFTAGPNGLPTYTVNISASEIASAFDVDLEAITPGDRLRIRTEVDKGGITFTDENSTPAITTAYGGLFDYNGVFTCPLADDFLVGDYTFAYTGGDPNGGFGNIFGPEGGTVTLETIAGSTTRRSFATSYIGSFAVTPVIDFVCTNAVPLTVDTGVGCGGGSITLGGGASGPFNITDAGTSFSLEYIQFQETGGCSASATPVTITFTKV